ncbi:MAG: sugar transferase [Methylotenera sp.]|nr:sugar transferase [Oligoflexia bacterium]
MNSTRFIFKGLHKNLLFVIFPDEEVRLRAVLQQYFGSHKILVSGTLAGDELGSPVDIEKLNQLVSRTKALVVTSKSITQSEIIQIIYRAHLDGKRVLDFEGALLEIDPVVSSDPSEMIRNLAQKGTFQDPSLRLYSAVKYAVEPVLAFFMLILLSPVFLLVSLLVKLTSEGPIFYRQTRVGLKSRPFEIVKFRSMRTDAEKNGPVWASAAADDSRLSPVGALLRATHLDELPQLLNVARGELSFIGPRPERPVFVEQLEKEIPMFSLRTLVKPGITGWAQVRQGYANSTADSRRKLEFDLFYLMKRSPWLDATIVFNTTSVMLSGGTEGRKRRIQQAVRRKGLEKMRSGEIASA